MVETRRSRQARSRWAALLFNRWIEQDGDCIWCGEKTWPHLHMTANMDATFRRIFGAGKKSPHRRATREHIVPKDHKGRDDPINIVCACKRCNTTRGNRADFYRPHALVLSRLGAKLQRKIILAAGEPEMANGSYDNTNSGVIFPPHHNQTFSGQGMLNIDGRDTRVIMVYEPLKKDGKPELVLYERLGPLFKNDKKGNDKAPDNSGPLDQYPGLRIAGWKGLKDGLKYLSLKISQKQSQGGATNGSDGWDDEPGAPGSMPDDEIPF